MQFAPWGDAWTLEDYVRSLLTQGKRSQDPEFQILLNVFGKEKITLLAKRLLETEGKSSSSSSTGEKKDEDKMEPGSSG